MSNANSKLAALGAALDIGDDTGAVERPAVPAPTVRQILETTPPPKRVVPYPEPPVRRSRVSQVNDEPKIAELHVRSSVNLPVTLSSRVTAAKTARWELSELLESALTQADPTPTEADRILNELQEPVWVQRHYRLTATSRNHLDDLASSWRMNRSEAIAVMLSTELVRLGFGEQ